MMPASGSSAKPVRSAASSCAAQKAASGPASSASRAKPGSEIRLWLR